ncbi:tetratricopeptide repeat protein, partial [Phenylobacterium sp.]|uniref:tetratricopeptide repeat protein n=1 Tax=Phenylobacterium sp. TaxID=1871053 RepID=UPI002ED94B2D
AVERGAGEVAEQRFEALAQTLTLRVEAVRAEVADALAAPAGGAFEARFAALTDQVQIAERRAAQAVEDIGRQVLAMAEAVGRKLTDVDQKSADAIDQVGTEVARIAGAVELRLARAEQTQAESFERLTAEFARVSDSLAGRPTAPELGPPPEPEPEFAAARPALAVAPEPEQQTLADIIAALGPPPEPEPEEIEPAAAAFGPELFSRAEAVRDDLDAEVVDPPWRRLDLDVPEPEVPDTFAPLAEDDDLFEADPAPAGPQLSTREVIERARAAARAAQDAAREAEQIGPSVARARAAEVRAQLGTRAASGRLFQGFAMKPRRAPNSALQTALMVAGGAAFLSVGAAGLTIVQAPDPAPEALQAEGPPLPAAPRAAMALGPASFLSDATTATPSSPVFAEVRAEVEAGLPGAVGKLKALADAHHAQAQLYLAQLYDGGEAGLPKNPIEARRLTALAADQGDVKAMHNLGVYLFRGEGGAQDLAGAAQWFRKAAAAGVVESQYNLGLLYQSGNGVAQDTSQARYWFRLAAARGDAEARRALSDLKAPAQTAQR